MLMLTMTPRDFQILWTLFRYRFLPSGLLARHTHSSSQVIRRRIDKRLEPAGYVKTLPRRNRMEQKIYTLGRKGYQYIASELETPISKLPYSRRPPKFDSSHWPHYLMILSIRTEIDLAVQRHPFLQTERFIDEWELGPNRLAKDPFEKFLLWKRLKESDQAGTPMWPFQPDGLFLLYNEPVGPEHTGAFFLEADTGSESIVRKIQAKYEAYRLHFDQNLCYFDFGSRMMRCLFVLNTKTEQRIHNMRKRLQLFAKKLGDPNPKDPYTAPYERSPASFVWIFRWTLLSQLNEENALNSKCWFDWQGNPVSLLRSSSSSEKAA